MKKNALLVIAGIYCILSTGHSQEIISATRSFTGSSQDWWDQRFHPDRYQARQKARLDEWYKKWETLLCTADHVKEYWLLTLLIPEPSSLSGEYKPIAAHNERIQSTIRRGDVDFEAADLADQINVEYLNKQGRSADADLIENRRQERLKEHAELLRQQEYAARFALREALLQGQIQMLAQKIRLVQQEADQERIQAQLHH